MSASSSRHFYEGAYADVEEGGLEEEKEYEEYEENDEEEVEVEVDEEVNGKNHDCENYEDTIVRKISLQQHIRDWALKHRSTHASVTDILHILRDHGMNYLPADSRTLLETPSSVEVKPMGNGQYWYNGIRNSLQTTFSSLDAPIAISLVFSIDGLPPFKSSPIEFWPILFKIENMSKEKPIMVVAIYCGETKPPLQDFLIPFIDKLNDVLKHGVISNGHKIKVAFKYFVCDTPARSFIKGTVGFNAAHGCIKCTVIGEYDKGGRHMSFPKIDCLPRTDESFRNQTDESHHKVETPLIKLPMDIVEDIIIADSLHLFDLGLMRKCLSGWIKGSYNFRTKLSGRDIDLLSDLLEECNKRRPAELHRAIRRLKCLSFWKGAEYRTFLLYVGPVVLKDFLNTETYHHFLGLSCAVTIMSCKTYSAYIHIADQLLKDYIEQFIDIYGIDSISSSVHNLCHVINDVKKFGILPDISSYPFENFLGHIKSLVRTGNKPLAQVAKRVLELSKFNSLANFSANSSPYVKNECSFEKHQLPSCKKVFNTVCITNDFMLANNLKNKWFLTKTQEIVSLTNATYHQDKIHINGRAIADKHDFFELPIKSSHLNIYKSNGNFLSQKLYSLNEIKCKLISLKYNHELVFLPLIHTLDVDIK